MVLDNRSPIASLTDPKQIGTIPKTIRLDPNLMQNPKIQIAQWSIAWVFPMPRFIESASSFTEHQDR